MENLLKELVEQKIHSKKCFDEEKRRYDDEHRKVSLEMFST